MDEKITVIIITLNEEEQIRDCIESVKDLADEIIVIDSLSSDRTVEICNEYANRVYLRPYERTARTRNWGAQHARNDWILSVDADERYTPELIDEIRQRIKEDAGKNINGYEIPFDFYCFGRLMRHWKKGEYHLRLFRKSCGGYEDREVHAKVIVSGEVGRLRNAIKHYPYPSVRHLIRKIIRYTRWDAEERYKHLQSFNFIEPLLTVFKPPYNFMRMYFIQGMWKDGCGGFVIAAVRCWYTFLTDIRFYRLCINKGRSVS